MTVAITTPKVNGNKSWLFTSLLAAVGVGPEAWNAMGFADRFGDIPDTPSWMVVGVGILALLAIIHKLAKIETMLKEK